MKPVRSLLYVPANKEDWVTQAPSKYDADALIFDLGDSVPRSEKPDARTILAEHMAELGASETVVGVRLNSETMHEDLEEIARTGLDAVFLPKINDPHEVQKVEEVLAHLEAVRDLETSVDIVPLLETATAVYNAYDICDCSDRVVAVCGGGTKHGDINRSLGYQWTREGTETLYLRSKIVLEARAAGLEQIFNGTWTDIDDIDGLRTRAGMGRQLGFTGYQVIHPSHIEHVNEIFTPDEAEIEYYQQVIERLREAEQEEGTTAVRFEGELIDTADKKTAERVLERARMAGFIE